MKTYAIYDGLCDMYCATHDLFGDVSQGKKYLHVNAYNVITVWKQCSCKTHISVNLQADHIQGLLNLMPKYFLSMPGKSDNLKGMQECNWKKREGEYFCKAPIHSLVYSCMCIVPALCSVYYSSISQPFFLSVQIQPRPSLSLYFSCRSLMLWYTNEHAQQ